MKSVYDKVAAFVLLFAILASCKYEANNNKQSKETDHPDSMKDSPIIKADTPPLSLTIEKINAEQFRTASHQERTSKPVQKITNFKTVQKELAGVVDFKEMDGYVGLEKISFRNGTSTDNKDILDECTFVAYFPTEDIILLECGHTTDKSYDLSTGQETYEVGNLDLASTSPSGKYRLNRVFEGQECFYHFMQEKKNNKFQKVFELDKIFNKKFNKWLCVIEKGFWTDDETFYFREIIQYKETGNTYEYYKLKIIEGHN